MLALCVSVKTNKNLVAETDLSQDDQTLYASSSQTAYSCDYDPASSSINSPPKTLILGMNTENHTTRTLLISKKAPGMLLISRGSTANIDPAAADLSSGHSQIRAFDLNNVPTNGYQYDTDGILLGWGLRNSVRVAEHPDTGGIYSVENSADQLAREGQDIYQENPGEEMNYHTWAPSAIPENEDPVIGSQFSNSTANDNLCVSHQAPRLTFQAHMAPLDIKSNNSGNDG
ncbi:hypothetical protein MMC28_000087 [Mycoblastus sanguinarius]|nr:hypothetical protein [Mycoblastus sanguinarius]